MAYYTALIAAWNGATQPPTGVTGSALLGGDTTAQKIAKVNAWTISGAAIPCQIAPSQIFNCIDTVAHANAVTALQWAVFQFLAGSGQPITAPPGSLVRSWVQSTFTGQATTLANFAALIAQYDTPPVLWVTAPNGGNLGGVVSITDTIAAGLT